MVLIKAAVRGPLASECWLMEWMKTPSVPTARSAHHTYLDSHPLNCGYPNPFTALKPNLPLPES